MICSILKVVSLVVALLICEYNSLVSNVNVENAPAGRNAWWLARS